MFKKGQSGNPNGRPKGSRSKLHCQLDEAIEKDAPEIVAALITRAKNGDAICAELLLKRVYPRKYPTIRFHLPPIKSIADLPAALIDILRQVADGDMAPESANLIGNLLGAVRGAFESSELASRIAALEQQLLAGQRRPPAPPVDRTPGFVE